MVVDLEAVQEDAKLGVKDLEPLQEEREDREHTPVVVADHDGRIKYPICMEQPVLFTTKSTLARSGRPFCS